MLMLNIVIVVKNKFRATLFSILIDFVQKSHAIILNPII